MTLAGPRGGAHLQAGPRGRGALRLVLPPRQRPGGHPQGGGGGSGHRRAAFGFGCTFLKALASRVHELRLCGKTISVANMKFGLWAIHAASEGWTPKAVGFRFGFPF